MHMEHTKAVLDACHLRQDQDVMMSSGRAAHVHSIKPHTIVFKYLESGKPDDYIEVPRRRVHELVRI